MNDLKFTTVIFIAAVCTTIAFAGDYPLVWVNNAQTGKQDRTLNGKTIYADVSSNRAHLSQYSANRRVQMTNESAARQNIDARFKLFTSIDRVTAARMTRESTARQAHIQNIVPAGGHPAAGNNRQNQYNDNGFFAGAVQSRYSSGSNIFQATDRYTQTVLHKNSSGAITAYMLGGQGILVLGSPYTDAFTISSFNSWYVNNGGTNLLVIISSSTHSVDTQTLIKGSTVVFRGFTSFNHQTALTFIARGVPHPPVNVRMVVTDQVRDINGNYMFKTYSSPFVRYSSL